ncbi:outer membrane porin protein precursor [mine drainage metagenome]|uniref:Outer membrane porin protein n=1 Tax=mine drainage metagenome TaxID=410659 RepID=A0A1J5RMU1_9ZZZZ
MQKKMIALAVAAALTAPAAFADTGASSVSLYGVLDLGVAQMTNAGDFSSNFVTGAVPIGAQPPAAKIGTVRGMMNGGESQSRWGIKGSEDLGDGSSAFFQLESAFSLGTGQLATSGLAGGAANVGGINNREMIADTALNGQLFNRMALIGLSNADLGTVTFGRQYSLQLDIIGSVGGGYDPVNAQMFSPINFSGAYGGGGFTDNSRVDNAIKYAKKIGNFNVNAMYGMGGMAGATSARTNFQANAGYEADTFGVQAAVQYANDTTALGAGTTANTVTAMFADLTSYMLAGRWQVAEPLTLKAGYERMQISAPSNFGADQGLQQIYGYNLSSAATQFSGQKNINVYWLGANWQVAPATKVSVGFYDAKTPAFTGTGSVAGADGSDKYYSAMVEYNLSKKTNLYAAAMHDVKSGGLLVAATGVGSITSFNTYGAGLRVKF